MTTLGEMGQTDRLRSSQISRLAGFPLVRPLLVRPLLACFALLASSGLAACGSKVAEAPPPAQPLSEERATHLIAGILEQSGSQPARGMAVPLDGGATLDVDVGDVNGAFGIAYITATDRAKLGKSLPHIDKSDNAPLTVIRGPEGQPILMLDADSYTYDDARGEDHEEPTAIAEGKLRRDVRDFLVHVAKKP